MLKVNKIVKVFKEKSLKRVGKGAERNVVFFNFKKIVKDVQERPFATIPELIYIGLVDKSGVTKETVLDDYGITDMDYISEILYKALYGSVPTEENKKK